MVFQQGVLSLTGSSLPSMEGFVVAADSASSLQALQEWFASGLGGACLVGGDGAGKTHLLQAMLRQVEQRSGSTAGAAYVPGRDGARLSPEVLQGLEHLRLVCVDDVDRLLQGAGWQEAIYRLLVRLADCGGQLLLSAQHWPLEGVEHAGLLERLQWALPLPVQALTEAEDQKLALSRRAHHRGVQLPDDVLSYLVREHGSDMAQLMHVLDYLDHASMTLKRRLTLPFVRQVLCQTER